MSGWAAAGNLKGLQARKVENHINTASHINKFSYIMIYDVKSPVLISFRFSRVPVMRLSIQITEKPFPAGIA